MENEKKSFFKRKGFWITAIVVIVVLFFAMMGDDDSTTVNQDNTETVSNDNNTEDKDEVTSEEEEEDTDIVTELTPAYMCEKLQDNEEAEYELSDKADIFLNENPLLFPTKKKSKIKKYIDYSIDYRHLSKNSSKYGDKLMALQGAYVVSCSEENIDDDTVLTELQLSDSDSNNFIVYYFGELSDILEEDTVDCYGLPLGTTSFDNVSGGTTLAGVLAGSYIKKIG